MKTKIIWRGSKEVDRKTGETFFFQECKGICLVCGAKFSGYKGYFPDQPGNRYLANYQFPELPCGHFAEPRIDIEHCHVRFREEK